MSRDPPGIDGMRLVATRAGYEACRVYATQHGNPDNASKWRRWENAGDDTHRLWIEAATLMGSGAPPMQEFYRVQESWITDEFNHGLFVAVVRAVLGRKGPKDAT